MSLSIGETQSNPTTSRIQEEENKRRGEWKEKNEGIRKRKLSIDLRAVDESLFVKITPACSAQAKTSATSSADSAYGTITNNMSLNNPVISMRRECVSNL